MRVLLSACACAPYGGSELEIGWRWALEVARAGHEVCVLTRQGHQTAIERALQELEPLPLLRFAYYDPPRWLLRLLGGGLGVRLRYWLWQRGAHAAARELCRNTRFDRVHHVTWQAMRYPSRMGDLGPPFVFGPVGGGERAPWRLRVGYGVRGWLGALARDVSAFMTRLGPWTTRLGRCAETVVATTSQTAALVPPKYRHKVRVQLGIGCDLPEPRADATRSPSPCEILYVGRFLDWKGMHLGLPAFARAHAEECELRLTLIGAGPSERRWRRLARRHGVAQSVRWLPWMPREDLLQAYSEYYALLFPSLHDPGGMALLEAMARALPVVGLDLGGPGLIVDDACGRAIRTQGRSRREVIQSLADALAELATDQDTRSRLGQGARARASEYQWSRVICPLYGNAEAL